VYICFDLEACGNIRDVRSCRIWDIAAINIHTGERFNELVNPWPKGKEDEQKYPPVKHAGAFPITSEFFSNVESFSVIGHKFYNWIITQQRQLPVVLVSHGNFVLDKPLLEKEFGQIKFLCPSNWYFYDTLPLFRTLMKKQPSYSLQNLYEFVFKEKIKGHHRAMPDAEALHRMLFHVNPHVYQFHGVYYPAYYTPLQKVKFLGNYNEKLLISGGVQCVEDLHSMLVHKCRLNVSSLKNILQKQFYITNDSSDKISNSLIHLLLCS